MEKERASAIISAAKQHLDAPDRFLIQHLDLDELIAWTKVPRWELWRTRAGKSFSFRQIVNVYEAGPFAEAGALYELGKQQRRGKVFATYWVEENLGLSSWGISERT